MVAQELREFEQARKDYQQALQIKIEFGDRRNLGIVIQSLQRIHQPHPSPQLLTTIGQAIGCSETEVEQLFEQDSFQ